MIHKLRKRHRLSFVILLILLPALLVIALMQVQHKGIPTLKDLPWLAATSAIPEDAGQVSSTDVSWLDTDVAVVVHAVADSTKSHWISVTPRNDLRLPDPIVYWHSEASEVGSQLPADAVPLLSLTGTRTVVAPISPEWIEQAGYLVLYSQANREIYACTKLQ